MVKKPKNKSNGEGSIYKRKDGRWVGQYTIGTGRMSKTRHIYGKTQSDVRVKLTKALADRDSGLLFNADSMTMDRYLDGWLKSSMKDAVKPVTYDSYKRLVHRHIIPALGGNKLKDLTPDHVRRFRRSKLDAGLSTRTVQYLLTLLRKALQQAVDDGLIPRNVAQGVKVKQVGKSEIRYLTREETKALLRAARSYRLEALYALAINTGLRQGELMALRWKDIDLDAGTLSVKRTLSGSKNGPLFTAPKTAQSRRSVKLTRQAIKALKRHRRIQDKERWRLGTLWEDNDLIFRSTTSTPLNRHNLITRSFKPLLAKASLPHTVRFHDLRHTAATLFLSKGVHPKVVQEMLGHSSIRITMDTYSHVLPTMQEGAIRAMEDLLS